MSDLHSRESKTVYNQKVGVSQTSNDQSELARNTSSAQESQSQGASHSENSRQQESTESGKTSGRVDSASREDATSKNDSTRTSETTRSLTGKSTQVTRSNDKANIAFQVSFVVPIRSTTPISPDGASGSC